MIPAANRDEDYGGRVFSCRDPEGHLWNIGSYDPCSPVEWNTILPPAAGGDPNRALAARGVDFIYVDSEDMLDPARRQVIRRLSSSEWQRLSPRSGQGWTLFRRRSTVPNAKSTSSPT